MKISTSIPKFEFAKVFILLFAFCSFLLACLSLSYEEKADLTLPQKLAQQKHELHQLEELLLMQMKMYCTQVSGPSSRPSWEGDELVCLKASRD